MFNSHKETIVSRSVGTVTCQPARPFPVAASPLQHEIIIVILCDPEFKRVFEQYILRLEPHVWNTACGLILQIPSACPEIYIYICLMFWGVCLFESLPAAHVHKTWSQITPMLQRTMGFVVCFEDESLFVFLIECVSNAVLVYKRQ